MCRPSPKLAPSGLVGLVAGIGAGDTSILLNRSAAFYSHCRQVVALWPLQINGLAQMSASSDPDDLAMSKIVEFATRGAEATMIARPVT